MKSKHYIPATCVIFLQAAGMLLGKETGSKAGGSERKTALEYEFAATFKFGTGEGCQT